ncbi:MAG: hypothetical protein LBJ77_00445 [Holosporales bacterium]|nr:hypothetical protein [Holosporales bacterium]
MGMEDARKSRPAPVRLQLNYVNWFWWPLASEAPISGDLFQGMNEVERKLILKSFADHGLRGGVFGKGTGEVGNVMINLYDYYRGYWFVKSSEGCSFDALVAAEASSVANIRSDAVVLTSCSLAGIVLGCLLRLIHLRKHRISLWQVKGI